MTRSGFLGGVLTFSLLLMTQNQSVASLVFKTEDGAKVKDQAVAATVTFGEIGEKGLWDGTLTLRNDASVTAKAQLLTGVLFAFDGLKPTLSLISAGLGEDSSLVLDKSGKSTTAPIDLIGDSRTKSGRWQFLQNPGKRIGEDGFNQPYGLSTIGGDTFSGKIVGNDNYSILGPGTDVSLGTFAKQFPYIRGAITFQFGNLPAEGITLDSIKGIKFVYGSEPDGFVSGVRIKDAASAATAVPEISTSLSALVGSALGLTMLRRKRTTPV